MTNGKMTIREGFEKARAYYESVGDTQMVEFFDARLVQVEKKNSAERKPTAKQVENSLFKTDILNFMESGKEYTSADITKGVPSIVAAGITASRVAAMMGQLFKDGSLNRTEVKGKFVYTLA